MFSAHFEQLSLRSARRVPPLAWLTLVTLFGAALRFISLDQPALWGDESLTYSRVCGSFREMLDVLQRDGFMPLHYLLYWFIGRHFELSPVVMRLPVAVAGALMPPAMYFLARQFRLSPATALVTALFTAGSAYMLGYSRDAKMYMPFWLAVALHVGCLMWWLRAARPPIAGDPTGGPARFITPPASFRYLCWLATGVWMIGYHALGLVVVAVGAMMFLLQPLGALSLFALAVSTLCLPWSLSSFVLRFADDAFTDRARWFATLRSILRFASPSAALLFLAGAAVIVGLQQAHFRNFSTWQDRQAERWDASGVQWVEGYNRDRTGAGLAGYTATAFLMNWEWPPDYLLDNIDPRVLKTLKAVGVAFAIIALLGVLPWRTCRRETTLDCDDDRRAIHYWALPTLLICAWLIVPAYVAYCRSVQPFYGPVTLLQAMLNPLTPASADSASGFKRTLLWSIAPAALLMFALIFLAVYHRRWLFRRAANAALAAVVTLALFALAVTVYKVMAIFWRMESEAGRPWRSIWMPRYVGALWPAFAIALCVLIMRLPTRGLRAVVITLLLAVNLTQFAVRVWGGSEPPTDKIAQDIAAAQPRAVRHQQLTLDVLRQTQAIVFGQPARPADIANQVRHLPLITSTVRTYGQTGFPVPTPGGGTIGSFPMRYYLCTTLGIDMWPSEMRRLRGRVDRQWTMTLGIAPKMILADLQQNPAIDRVIVWDRIDAGRRDVDPSDKLRGRLGKNWKRANEELFAARDHWRWLELYQLRRREYVRTAAQAPPDPTTAPETTPTSAPTSLLNTTPTTLPAGADR